MAVSKGGAGIWVPATARLSDNEAGFIRALVGVMPRDRNRPDTAKPLWPTWPSLLDAELRLAIGLIAHRLPLDLRHHVIKERVRLARRVQRQDVRMLQVGNGLDFLDEPLGSEHGRSSSFNTLTATVRSCLTSCAKYTVAMPPAPSSRSMV